MENSIFFFDDLPVFYKNERKSLNKIYNEKTIENEDEIYSDLFYKEIIEKFNYEPLSIIFKKYKQIGFSKFFIIFMESLHESILHHIDKLKTKNKETQKKIEICRFQRIKNKVFINLKESNVTFFSNFE